MTPPSLQIVGQDAGHAPVPTGHVLWQTAFRPFFIVAALAALLIIPAWLCVLSGLLPLQPALDPLAWHGHEMLHGFALAVIAGFLLTAAMVWTGHETLRGKRLIALVGLWIAGRVLMLTGPSGLWAAAVVNTAVPLVVASGIIGPIIKARSTRNTPFIALLFVLSAAEVALFGEALGYWVGFRSAALWLSLDVVAIMIVIVGGRIIPMFTKNAVGCEVRQANLLDRAAPWSLVAVAIAHAGGPLMPSAALYSLCGLAGLINLLRMRGWGSWGASRTPFVFILHLGYGLLALGLLTEAITGWTALEPVHPGRHVLALGGVTMLCMGMMTRVALGHTGRPLHPPAGTHALYAAVALSTVLRISATFVVDYSRPLLWAAGLLFAGAFAGYLALYSGYLISPRPDGKPG